MAKSMILRDIPHPVYKYLFKAKNQDIAQKVHERCAIFFNVNFEQLFGH